MNEKSRVQNFTSSEKLHLLGIISHKYASTIEDKKTNRASGEKKEKTWQQITNDFNATSSTGILRSMASLKKCYENRKKELRKTLADEKREVRLTGGGPLPKIKRDDTDELLMSIVNKNTLVGFQNKFDDDGDESRDESITIVCRDPEEENEVEILEYIVDDENSAENTFPERETLLSMDKTNISIAAKDDVNWRKYNPTKLQQPISAALVKNFTTTLNTDGNKNNVPDHSKSTSSKSRRRPTTVVKSLTSSDISKKYDLLLDKRLMLVETQLKHMEEENALIIKKRKLEIEILEKELLLKQKNSE